jgi:transposase-like protein
VPNIKWRTLLPIIYHNVLPNTTIYTDALHSYDSLKWNYNHKSVDHTKTYVDGPAHTNNAECLWSLLKRTINGTYMHVSPKHIGAYIQEQTYRYNTRKADERGRFEWVLGQVNDKRLTYDVLKARI